MKGEDLRIIDFEYSQANYRGIDIASLILESAMNYAVIEPPKYKFLPEYFPDFKTTKDKQIDVDDIIKVYLTRFYTVHAQRINPKILANSLEDYLSAESNVMKEELKNQILQQHLQWVCWSLLMTKGSLIDPTTKKLWTDDAKLEEAWNNACVFYFPYAKTRLDLYFS